MPSPQISASGVPGVALQTTPFPLPLHTIEPERRHEPSPTWQAVPTGNVSSMPFLQSSSSPLHSSMLSPVASLHFVPPPGAHTIVPSLHASLSGPSHGAPRLKPSSTWPSQSLSLPSQISGESIGPSLHADV